MSELERKLAGDGLVITGELPVVDGGGLEAVRAQARAVRALGGRRQRHRQHGRARARVQRGGGHRAASSSASSRSCRSSAATRTASRSRPTSSAPRCTASRTSPASPATTSRPATSRRRAGCSTSTARRSSSPLPRSRAASTSRAARSSRRRTSSSAPSRTPGAPPLAYRAAARAQEGARGRALPAAADRLRARASRGVLRRGASASGCSSTRRCCPRSASSPAHGRSSSWTPRCRASRCPRPMIERVKNAADPREEASSLPSNRRAHALAQPGVRGLHLISFRKDDAVGRLCERLGIPTTKERDASGHGSTVAV